MTVRLLFFSVCPLHFVFLYHRHYLDRCLFCTTASSVCACPFDSLITISFSLCIFWLDFVHPLSSEHFTTLSFYLCSLLLSFTTFASYILSFFLSLSLAVFHPVRCILIVIGERFLVAFNWFISAVIFIPLPIVFFNVSPYIQLSLFFLSIPTFARLDTQRRRLTIAAATTTTTTSTMSAVNSFSGEKKKDRRNSSTDRQTELCLHKVKGSV